MREMLFKAKSKDDEKWVVGYYVKLIWPAEDFYGIIPENTIMYSDNSVDVIFEIDPETLCQYTGMEDKNGERIWGNDIVLCKKYIGGNFVDYCIEYGFVEMKYGAYGIHRFKSNAYYRPFKDWLEDYEYEVIGNIFDNPELLEDVR